MMSCEKCLEIREESPRWVIETLRLERSVKWARFKFVLCEKDMMGGDTGDVERNGENVKQISGESKKVDH